MAIVTAASLWLETRAVVARHRETLLTLAGATVFLPSAGVRLLTPAVPPGVPEVPGYLLLLVGLVLGLQFAGLFAIAAIAADRAEGGGQPVRTTLAAAAPALGRFLTALPLLLAVLFAGAMVAVMAGMIVLTALGIVTPAMLAGAQQGRPPVILTVIGLVLFLPLLVWLWARLSPLVGVYLREELGVLASIRRAWELSRGAALPVAALLCLYLVASLGISALQFGSGGMLALLGNLIVAAIGALLFTYAAAGTGVVYRQLTS